MSSADIGVVSKDLDHLHLSQRSVDLPDEVLCRIFHLLSTKSLVSVSLVCSRWDLLLWSRLRYLQLDRNDAVDLDRLKRLNDACPELTTLNISRCLQIRDSCTTAFLPMRHLRSLHVDYCDWITDAFVEGLARHPSLTELSMVAACRISLVEPVLSEQLRILNLSACRGLDRQCLPNLARLKKLSRLYLSDSPAALALNDGIGFLKPLHSLTSLSLRSSGLNLPLFQVLGEMTQLMELDISQNPDITSACISCLAELTKLQRLDLSRCPNVTETSLLTLARFTSLEHLDISKTGIKDDGLQSLIPMQGALLRSFTAMKCRPTFPFLSGLSQSTQLTTLSLTDCSFDPADTYLFGACTSLQHLDISSAIGITDSLFPHLTRLIHLQTLNVGSSYTITSAGIAHLKSLPQLSHLILDWCTRMTDNIGAALLEFHSLSHASLRSCKRLTELALPNLLKIPKLEVLDLTYCTSMPPLSKIATDAQQSRGIRVIY